MELLHWLNAQLLRMQRLSDLVALAAAIAGPGSRQPDRRQRAFLHLRHDQRSLLLAVLIFAVSWVQSHFPPERTRRILGGMRGLRANTVGALLGTLTPFCSCSSIPLFIGFTSAGLPLGVTSLFLISSPLVDLASMILLASVFNWTVAISYVAVGIVLAVAGGTLIGALRMEGQVAEFVTRVPAVELAPQAMSGANARPTCATRSSRSCAGCGRTS